MPSSSTFLVLMADDDDDDRLLAYEALIESKAGYEIHFVKDGIELMRYLYREGEFSVHRNKPLPNLILLDLNMPRKDGREVLVELKADPALKKIPVVILTTSNTQEDMHYTRALGATAYQTKPVTFKGMVEFMKSLTSYSTQTFNSAVN